MGPLLLPRQQTTIEGSDPIPFGQTHPSDAPCPFVNDPRPSGFINTCCSIYAESVVKFLDTYGNKTLARVLRLKEFDAEKLPFVAKELRKAAAEVEARLVDAPDVVCGSSTSRMIDVVTDKYADMDRSTFDTGLASIYALADWYEKVGQLGFGIERWY